MNGVSQPDMSSDIWSLGASILQLLFDQSFWDVHTLQKQFVGENMLDILIQVTDPHFIFELVNALFCVIFVVRIGIYFGNRAIDHRDIAIGNTQGPISRQLHVLL